tara:strand:+ start:879 stop:1334 length:456 start_codon:yes stop_codon:yes gene_type:complete
MKLSHNNQPKFLQYRTYSHHEHDLDDLDGEFWPIIGILFAILGIWTGFIHLVDYLTWNVIPWWSEPFTIAPIVFLIVMKERYDSLNPAHWWPMFWGYNVSLPEDDRITIRPIDTDRILKQHGGRVNVHIIDYETIKFRKQKDAVIFSLRNS